MTTIPSPAPAQDSGAPDRTPVTPSIADDERSRARHHLRADEVALLFRKQYGEDNAGTEVLKLTRKELIATLIEIAHYIEVTST